jgi:Ca2+-transporting ATPase
MLVIYVPALHEPFGTFGLQSADWVVLVVASATILPVLELAKWMERQGWFGRMS